MKNLLEDRADEVVCGDQPCRGALPRVRYIVRPSGDRYVLFRAPRGKSLYSGPDAGRAIQTAIDRAAESGGQIELLAGTYRYATVVPTFPPNMSQWIRVRGRGATIVLSPGAPRAFDALRRADHDVIRNVWIEGLTIDAAELGGENHTVFGNRINGEFLPRFRVGFDNIVLRHIDAYNIATSFDTRHDVRNGISLEVFHQEGDETATTRVSNVLVDNVRLHGGNNGVMIVGAAADGASDPSIQMTNIRLEDVFHSLGRFGTRFGFLSSHFHIGSYARVGFVIIDRCEGLFSGDNGIEINNFDLAVVRDNHMQDQANVGYYLTNYNPTTDAARQLALLSRDTSDVTPAHDLGAFGHGFYFGADHAPIPLGRIILRDSTYSFAANNTHAKAVQALGEVRHIELNRFSAAFSTVTHTRLEEAWQLPFAFRLSGPHSTLALHSVSLRYSAAVAEEAASKGSAFSPTMVYISGEDTLLDISDIAVSLDVENFADPRHGLVEVFSLGRSPLMPGGRSTLRGAIRRVRVEFAGDDTDPIGIRFGVHLKVAPLLALEDLDLGSLPDPTTHLLAEDGLSVIEHLTCSSPAESRILACARVTSVGSQ